MTTPTQKKIPFATALRDTLPSYNWDTFRHDLTAGFIVSLIALPLSMALSIAVGLPPQNGLYTAIVAGIAGALFGGSPTQVSGPTAAFVVIIAPIVTDLGLQGLIWCQLLAGLFLILLGVLHLGRFIHHIPHAVVTGFTTGIAVTIALLALNDFLGLGIKDLHGHFIEKVITLLHNADHFQFSSFAVGGVTLATLFLFPRITQRLPSPIIAVVLGALLAWAFTKGGVSVETLATRFSFTAPDGSVHGGVPPYPPVFHWPGSPDSAFGTLSYDKLKNLLGPALLIAALAALESLLSARIADKMAHTHHDPDSELTGIGLANIFSASVLGIPATGAIARTATNIHSGGKTPVAAILHALFVLVYIVTLAPIISHIPMAALAALLLATAYRMSHLHEFVAILKTAPRDEILVMVVCFLLTVFIDMVVGVSAGIALSVMIFAAQKRAGTT